MFTKNPNYKGTLKLKNDKVELRSFEDADAMGTALDKGDIDMMTRTMSPAQIKKLSERHGRPTSTSSRCPAWRSATSASTPTPRR